MNTIRLKRERDQQKRPANPAMAEALKRMRLRQAEAEAKGAPAAELRPRFPAADMKAARKRVRDILPRGDGGRVLPLAVGIEAEVAERLGIDVGLAQILVGEVISDDRYLETLVEGGRRHDLDGQPVAEIRQSHRTFARGRLFERGVWQRRQAREARKTGERR